jgi:3-hydroxyacyl-CoA dehydrogenase
MDSDSMASEAAAPVAGLRAHRAGPGGRVLVLSLDNPPSNALTPALRGALIEALVSAAEGGPDGAARSVVLRGEGRNFSAATSVDGAPAGPGGGAGPEGDGGHPTLAELCRVVEELPLPVVVLLTGAAVGPGAELAIAAHARVADPEARLVLPEVGLGLPPHGGTTQRLPRLVGAAEALDILLKARAVPAPEGLAIGLVDQIAEGDTLAAAVAHAAAMTGPRPVRDRAEGLADVAANAAAVAEARAEVARGVLPAPGRIVDCIEAALYLPLENGLAMEAVAHEDLAGTDEARGLVAAARAERRAAVLPAPVAQAAPRAVGHLGLAGNAPQMAALALVALSRGLRVSWADADRAALAQGMKWVAARQEAELRAGRLSVVQRDADWARLAPADGVAGLAGAGVVVHAVAGPELAVARRMLPEAAHLVLNGAEGALGLALAPSARGAELALPAQSRPADVAAAVQTLRRLALPPVLVGKMPVVGRRVTGAGRAALARLLALGVPRRVIAAALDGFGHPMPDLRDPEAPAPMRAMPETEVLRRWLAAQANEGLRLLDARVALRPSDIDHILVQGHGFPRWRGGPMHQASSRGLMVLRADMHGWMAEDAPDAPLWAPHPLMDRLIAAGRRLADLDAA